MGSSIVKTLSADVAVRREGGSKGEEREEGAGEG